MFKSPACRRPLFLEHEADRLDRFNYSTHLFFLHTSFLDGFHSSSRVVFSGQKINSGQKIKRQLGPESSQKTLKRTVTDTDFSPNPWPALAQSVERKVLNLVVVGSNPMVGVVALQRV